MDAEDARYLKRKVKGGEIDVHPTEKALVVHYQVEATILGEMGTPMLGDSKECEKVIKVPNLTDDSNIAALAKDIIEKCRLIHPSKLLEVEQLLYYLQRRKDSPNVAVGTTGNSIPTSIHPAHPDFFDDDLDIEQTANINDIDDYMELLYEDMDERKKGTALILQLARNPDNLEDIFQNETLVGALARVLKEEWKKSTELATNIVYIFFCFSSFSQFHGVIIHFKIGALCMNIIEHELNKYDSWKNEGDKRKDKYKGKVKEMIRKQEQLLRVSFYLLLNIAEDQNVEIKMKGKNIVGLLIRTLERKNHELLILVVSFLKKLSIYRVNKDEMFRLKAVEKLASFIPCEHDDLLNVSLRLLMNLSFDPKIREQIVRNGLLPKLVDLIGSENHRGFAICTLYHLSLDDKCKSMFSFTNCIPTVMRLLLNSKDEKPELPLIALCINLATNKRCAEFICQDKGQGLRVLIKKAFKYKDVLFMKMIRNLSQHSGNIKEFFLDYIDNIAAAVKSDKNGFDFQVESLGILSNLTIEELDWEMVAQEYKLIPWISENLSSVYLCIQGAMINLDCDAVSQGQCEDELMLGIVMLIGTMCLDDNAAKMIANSGFIQTLIELLNAKQEDDEMVCQIIYVFYQMIFRESTREIIIRKTQAPAYLIDLMHDKNTEIRRLCDSTLDVIAEQDSEWGAKIQLEKFRWHNSQWLDMVESRQIDNMAPSSVYGPSDPDDFAAFIQDTDILDRPELFYGNLNGDNSEEDFNFLGGAGLNIDSSGDPPFDSRNLIGGGGAVSPNVIFGVGGPPGSMQHTGGRPLPHGSGGPPHLMPSTSDPTFDPFDRPETHLDFSPDNFDGHLAAGGGIMGSVSSSSFFDGMAGGAPARPMAPPGAPPPSSRRENRRSPRVDINPPINPRNPPSSVTGRFDDDSSPRPMAPPPTTRRRNDNNPSSSAGPPNRPAARPSYNREDYLYGSPSSSLPSTRPTPPRPAQRRPNNTHSSSSRRNDMSGSARRQRQQAADMNNYNGDGGGDDDSAGDYDDDDDDDDDDSENLSADERQRQQQRRLNAVNDDDGYFDDSGGENLFGGGGAVGGGGQSHSHPGRVRRR